MRVRSAVFVTSALFALPVLATTSQAQTAPETEPSIAVPPADSAAMEKRIKVLEQQLQKLLAAGNKSTATTAESSDAAQAGGEAENPAAIIANEQGFVTEQEPAPDPAVAAAAKIAKAPDSNKPAKEPATGDGAALLLRESAPTLDSMQWEWSTKVNYNRNVTTFQSDRIFTLTESLRAGIAEGVELGIVVPAYLSERQTKLDVFGSNLRTEQFTSIGDVSLQSSVQLWSAASWYPGASFLGSIALPTGEDNYVFQTGQDGSIGTSQVDPFRAMQSRGHWGGNGSVQFYKTYDPIILFGGVGGGYTFAKDVDGHSFAPGWQYNFNFGISVAFSEYTTLGFQLNGALSDPLTVDGHELSANKPESMQIQFTAVHKLARDLYFEPSVAIGVTDESPDVTVGMGLNQRF